jgi:hypothetical protein
MALVLVFDLPIKAKKQFLVFGKNSAVVLCGEPTDFDNPIEQDTRHS